MADSKRYMPSSVTFFALLLRDFNWRLFTWDYSYALLLLQKFTIQSIIKDVQQTAVACFSTCFGYSNWNWICINTNILDNIVYFIYTYCLDWNFKRIEFIYSKYSNLIFYVLFFDQVFESNHKLCAIGL